jgi:elongation factor Ts
VAEISATQVKELRDRTGAGMMDCKKALAEANGDLSRAQDVLRERGLVKARGRAGRTTSEGRIEALVAKNGKVGVLVELNCETDFVAKTDEFAQLMKDLATAVAAGAGDVNALLAAKVGSATGEERIVAAIAKLGENMQLARVTRLEAPANGRVDSYVHAGGKIGALVQIEAANPDAPNVVSTLHQICMHVAASVPLSVSRDDLNPVEIDKERAVLRAQAEQEGKPAAILEKMIEGRLSKFFKEVVLVEQPLVMDPDKSVGDAAKAVGAKVLAFRRFQLGETSAA